MYLGTWELDDLITFTVNTHDPATGVEIDADAFPTYRIYEDETGTAILTGVMAILDDTNTIGYYSEQITLSAANGFEVGKSYSIRIRAIVDTIAAATIRHFQVELAPATATALATVQSDTDNIQTRLPAALVSGRMDSSIGAVASGVIAAASFAANALDAVWSTATRLLTAGTNIVLAKGTGVTGFNDLSAAQVNTEADTALADYDAPTNAEMVARTLPSASYALETSLQTVDDFLDTEVAAIKAKTDNLPASPAAVGSAMTLAADSMNASALATDAITELVNALGARIVEGAITYDQVMRLLLAADGGKTSGGLTTTFTIRDASDTKDRIVATVDGAGNRTAVVRDLT